MIFVSALLGIVPFTAIQLLWVNFVTDIFPAMALGVDPPHQHIMTKKPTGKKERLINKHLGFMTALIGFTKFVIMFIIYYSTVLFTHNPLFAQSLSFTWLVFTHLTRVISIRFDERESMFNNPLLTISVAIPIILQLIILYIPAISKLFAVVVFPWWGWFVLSGGFLLSILVAKLITRFVAFLIPFNEKDY